MMTFEREKPSHLHVCLVMDGLLGIQMIQGNFNDRLCKEQILAACNFRPVDVILS